MPNDVCEGNVCVDERLGADAMLMKYLAIRLLWRCGRLFPIREEVPSMDYPPPAEGLGGNDSLIIGDSQIPGAGRGCFADRDYRPGEIVCEYTGTALTTLEKMRTRDWSYMMGLGKNRDGRRVHIDSRAHLRVKSRYINHHFDESKWNLSLTLLPDEKKAVFKARVLICQGDELHFNYGRMHWLVNERGKKRRTD